VRSITSAEPTVPQGPEEELIKVTGRAHNEPVEKKLLELLEKRPVWTRTAIQNQLTSEELRILNKYVFPVCRDLLAGWLTRTLARLQSEASNPDGLVHFLRWTVPRPRHQIWI
jgi:hypothetical protein